MGKATGFIASAVLIAGLGVAHAGERPQILGAADYQALHQSEMASITGQAAPQADTATSAAIRTDANPRGRPAAAAQSQLPQGVAALLN